MGCIESTAADVLTSKPRRQVKKIMSDSANLMSKQVKKPKKCKLIFY